MSRRWPTLVDAVECIALGGMMIRRENGPAGLVRAIGAVLIGLLVAEGSQAQLAISESGSPRFSYPITVPPGVAGMAPQLALSYNGGGVNGVVGHGWTIQGMSLVGRCPGVEAVDGDGKRTPIKYQASDKLCLDGQRLIPTNDSGVPVAVPEGDASGLSSATTCRDYRTEVDSYARIRACGSFNAADRTRGPLFFKVWTKSGQIHYFGAAPGTEAHSALIQNVTPAAPGAPIALGWAIARITDTLGNAINFKYTQEDVAWGTGLTSVGGPKPGRQWGLSEITYAGGRVAFNYEPGSPRTDKSEAYHAGAKQVSAARLHSITTFIPGSAGGYLPVKSFKIGYGAGQTGRSRVQSIKECAGDSSSTHCLPETVLEYSNGGPPAFTPSSAFTALQTARLTATDGKYGVLVADFNRDGLTDLLRWADNGAENELWLSRGDGSFAKSGAFNITEQLNRADGCYQSLALDVNADGAVDIVRVPSGVNTAGTAACGVGSTGHFFVNNGSGAFTKREITSGGAPIPLDRKPSKYFIRYYCGAIPQPPRSGTRLEAVQCEDPRESVGWPEGATYYLLDFDGDGKLDLIKSRLAARLPSPDSDMLDPSLATPFLECKGCTRVFRSLDGQGAFMEVAAGAIQDYSVYANPGIGANLRSLSNVADYDGDGWADLVPVGTPWRQGTWRSRGDGTFDQVPLAASCTSASDFNGDGRTDCMGVSDNASHNLASASDGAGNYLPASAFNLNKPNASHELDSGMRLEVGKNFGSVFVDIDGDGRQDILRWHDDPAFNRYYRSKGDGSFVDGLSEQDLPLVNAFQGIQLKKSSGEYDVLMGDFTGRGFVEFIRVSSAAPSSTDPSKQNRLYLPQVTEVPDLLVKVTSGTGAVTRLSYASLANSARPGSSDVRYAMDSTTPPPPGPGAPAAPRPLDVTPAMWVVTDVDADNGLGAPGSQMQRSRYAYRGLKIDPRGRSLLGFREVRREVLAPNGQQITTRTTYLQQHPYIGFQAVTESRLATLWSDSIAPFSVSQSVYCDVTLPGSEASATVTSPCQPATPSYPSIRRPYQRGVTQTGKEITGAGVALPTVVTTSSHLPSGDVESITVSTSGVVAGISQTVTRTTTNKYRTDDVSCDAGDATRCRWVLGRLERSTVSNTVTPDLLTAGLTPGLGSSPPANAGAVAGSAAVLVLGNCTVQSPATAPTAATISCSLSNSGNAAASAITYFVQSQASGITATGPTSCPAGGSSCGTVKLTSPSTAGLYSGTLHVGASAPAVSSTKRFNVEVKNGTEQAATLTTPLAFGNVQTGQSSTLTATLANTSTTVALSVTLPMASSVSGTDFTFVSTTCGASLAPSATCAVVVRFSPSAVASRAGTLSINTGAGVKRADLTGAGVPAQAATLTSPLSFGNLPVGQTGALTATLTNTSATLALTVTPPGAGAVTGTDFSLDSTTCGTSLAPGAACSVVVRFAPSAVASRTGNLAVATGAGVMNASLNGAGVTATQTATLSSPLSFGITWIGQSALLNATLKNTSSTTALSVTRPNSTSVTGTDFSFGSTTCGTSLAPGATCLVSVLFTPSAAAIRTGVLSVSTGAGLHTSALTGTGSSVSQSATLTGPLIFGNVLVGQSATLNATLKNTSTTANLTVAPPDATSVSSGADFSFVSTTCGASLAPGASCVVAVRFAPTAAFPRTGTLTVSTGAGVRVLSLSGTGTVASQTATLTPAPLNFGNVLVGNASTLNSTLKNTSSTVTLTLVAPSAASVSGTDYSFVSTTCGTSLAPGASCVIATRFIPSAAVGRNGTLTINTGAGEQFSLLTGTGTLPTQTGSLSPTLAFGNVLVGQNLTQNALLVNTSSTVVLNLTQPTAASVTGTDFSFVSTTCGTSLAPSATCTVTVRFTPSVVAARTGTLSLSTGAGPMTSNLSGTGALPPQTGSLTPSFMSFGGVQVGQNATLNATLTNTASSVVLSITPPTAASVAGTDFSFVSTNCGTTLVPAASCTVTVRFTPTATVSRVGALSVNTGAGLFEATLSGYGTGPQAATLTSPLNFGNVLLGNASTLNATLTNTSSTATLTLTPPSAGSVTGTDFSFVSTTCGTSLAPGASCVIATRFMPSAAAARSGTLTINTGAGVKSSSLTGTGTLPTQTGSLSPTLAFGNVLVGQSLTQNALLVNTSSTVVLNLTQPTAASVTGTDFSFVSTTCGTSLAPSATCTVTVRFTPSVVAARTGTLSLSTGAGPMTSNLSGTGALPPQTGSLTPSFMSFGGVQVGQNATLNATLTNTASSVVLSITPPTAASVAGTDFSFVSTNCGTTLVPAASCTVTVRFTPTATVSRVGALSVNTGAGLFEATLSGYGTGPQAATLTSPLNFGNVLLGNASTLNATLTNTSSTATLTLTPPSAGSVTGTDFSFVSTTCSSSLAPGASCVITTRFMPSVAGTRNGTLAVSTGAGLRSSALSGNGTMPVQSGTLTPSLAFGTVQVGQTATLNATLTNTSSTVTLNLTPPSAASVSGADFSFVSTTCGSGLLPNASCTVSVRFTPTAGTARSGTLFLSTGAGVMNTSLAGTGVTYGATVFASPSPIAFDPVSPRTAYTIHLVVTNVGPQAISGGAFEVINQAGVVGAGTFSAAPVAWANLPACTSAIPANTNCAIAVTYTASCTPGSTTAALRLFGSNFAPIQVPLSATTRSEVCS